MINDAFRPDFEFLIEKNADGIVVVDGEGLVLFANPAAEEIFGRPASELVGSPIGVPIDAGDTTEIVILRPGRSRIEAEMRVVNTSWNGAPACLASIRDISARRILEENLRQAHKMQALGQLTGGIAHDFNNLLTAVVGCLDMILHRTDDRKLRRLAENALHAAQRGARLTTQLLTFSRIQRLELQPVNVTDRIAGMEDVLRRTLGPSVEINLHLEDASAPVRADPTQLEMAVLNLAINARDAMPEGGALTIATSRRQISEDPELESGDYLELRVIDTGIGMTPETVARAFEPFFTTKGVGKGTGLGLSMVYGVAKQSGGVARIESTLGQGSTISLLLPVAAQAEQVERRDTGGAATRSDTRFQTATILVIDDDPDVRSSLTEMLASMGARALEAADGPSGLALLETQEPDLLIIDYAMPGMSGAQLAALVRNRRPDQPILFVSGYADSDALEAAAQDAPILRKPFRQRDLAQALEKLLCSKSATA